MKRAIIISAVGRRTLHFLMEIGRLAILLYRIILYTPRLIKDRGLIVEQMLKMGVNSLPLVSVVSIFTGAVSSWQAAYQLQGLISFDFLGASVSAAIFIELAPVLTAIVIAGRVSASIAAELGTMMVTEQIDALETLAISPVRYLAFPRFTAGWVMMPILVIYSYLVAHLGAFFVANLLLNIDANIFFRSVRNYFSVYNAVAGLIKALVFGAGTSLIGCSIGFRTRGGAEGVGKATIQAFVYSSAFILISDYVLAMILF